MKTNLKRMRTAIGAALCMLLIGCVSVGSNFDESKIAQIKQGETTEADLIRMFGEPRNRTNQIINGKSTRVLAWVFSKSNAFGGPFMSPDVKMKSLGVFLDANGKVERFTYSGDIPAGK